MFGLLRLLLASMVVFGHIFWVSDFGRFAVFSFYILSGYLMTYVMHVNYGYQIRGKYKFALNRALRLFPTYWAACLLTIILAISFGPFSEGKLQLMNIPQDFMSSITNLTMIFPHWMPNQIEPRLSPAAWALTVELFFYTLIALGISKTITRTYIWLLISLMFVFISYVIGLYWHARYFSIPAGSLPFALGALIYFIKDKPNKWIPQIFIKSPWLLFLCILAFSFVVSYSITKGISLIIMEILFYFSLFFNFILILILAKGYPFHNKLNRKIDSKFGEYSYPFYLLHYQIAIIVSYLLYQEVGSLKDALTLKNVSVLFLLLSFTSYLSIKVIEKPIQIFRKKIKVKQFSKID